MKSRIVPPNTIAGSVAEERAPCKSLDEVCVFLKQAQLLNDFGTWSVDPQTGALTISASAELILGLGWCEPRNIRTLLSAILVEDRNLVRTTYRHLRRNPAVSIDTTFRLITAAGEVRAIRAISESRTEPDGKRWTIHGVVQDATERQSMAMEIKRLTYYDGITSLPNLTLFTDIFAERLAQRKEDEKIAFLIVDLTRFREVNFALSHVVGDDLLRMVAQRIRAALGDRDAVARVGTRFPVLLQDADETRATQCAHAICTALEVPFAIAGISCEIGARVGISLCPDDDLSYRGLLRKADIAVAQAAFKGQPVASYDSATDTHTPRRLGLVGDFRHAVSKGEIRLYCQPKLEMRTRKVVGAEVLARWLHPRAGLIPPDDFIHLIEGTELIHVLTHHMLANAVQNFLQWRPLGIEVPLAVNLSTQDVATLSLSRYLGDLLSTTNIDPKFIELEVTESSLMRNPVASIGELNHFRAMGFRIHIDDFGTGYSSLNYLTQLPIDVIKIDNSFTMKMVNDRRSASIVRSTIHMAHDLGMTVVAEGTADIDIWNALDALDCDEAQGYYIARPMPIEDFPQWLHGAGSCFSCATPTVTAAQ
jgi:diguanylate cyclase (GGDEF)-like protein